MSWLCETSDGSLFNEMNDEQLKTGFVNSVHDWDASWCWQENHPMVGSQLWCGKHNTCGDAFFTSLTIFLSPMVPPWCVVWNKVSCVVHVTAMINVQCAVAKITSHVIMLFTCIPFAQSVAWWHANACLFLNLTSNTWRKCCTSLVQSLHVCLSLLSCSAQLNEWGGWLLNWLAQEPNDSLSKKLAASSCGVHKPEGLAQGMAKHNKAAWQKWVHQAHLV